MTCTEARACLTPAVVAALAPFQRREAWTPEALAAAAVPAPLVQALLADAPRVGPVAARTARGGRRRVLTTRYVWGPDIAAHLTGWRA